MTERSPTLVGEVGKENDVEIIRGHLSQDDVYIFVSVAPEMFLLFSRGSVLEAGLHGCHLR